MKLKEQEFGKNHIKFIQDLIANPIKPIEAALDECYSRVRASLCLPLYQAWVHIIKESIPSDNRVELIGTSIEMRVLVATMTRDGYTLEDILSTTAILGTDEEAFAAAHGALMLLIRLSQEHGMKIRYTHPDVDPETGDPKAKEEAQS